MSTIRYLGRHVHNEAVPRPCRHDAQTVHVASRLAAIRAEGQIAHSVHRVLDSRGTSHQSEDPLGRRRAARPWVSIDLTGPVPDTALQFFQQKPQGGSLHISDQNGRRLAVTEGTGDLANAAGVRATLVKATKLHLKRLPDQAK